jgi:hypothetical protein
MSRDTRGRFLKPGPSSGTRRAPAVISAGLDSPEPEPATLQESSLGLVHSPQDDDASLHEESQQHQTPPHIPASSLTSQPTPIASNTSVPRPPFVFPPVHLPVPQIVNPVAAIPPVPAGIDPAVWAHNQALVLSLLPALQALRQPAAAPAAALPTKEGHVKTPTSFSGEDPSKLREFLFECGLIFSIKPRTFATEQSRVLYAIQYLDGMAKRHFRRYIEDGSIDPIVNRWQPFVTELESVFGDPDRKGRASAKILMLKMKESSHVHRYTVQFKEAADELGWAPDVLHRLYYNGLPDRIKDLWARSDPPVSFDALVREAQRADTRYWKCVEEKKKSDAAQPRSTEQKSTSKSSSNTQPSKSTSKSSSSSSSKPARSNTTPSSSTKDLTKILGPDGKLLPAKRTRRESLGLCTYCGEKHGPVCPTKPTKSKTTDDSSNQNSASSSKSNNGSSNNSKGKGRVAQVVDTIAEESEPSEDFVDASDF